MKLAVTATDGITNYVFVNQRFKNYKTNTTEDVFSAVATPAQIEDFGKDAPLEGSSYFLTTSVDVISRNADYLNDTFNDIVNQLVKLIGDIEGLAVISDNEIYTITSSNVTYAPYVPPPINNPS